MLGSAPLGNLPSVVPRLHFLNESTDLTITKPLSVLLLQLQIITLCARNVPKVNVNMLKPETQASGFHPAIRPLGATCSDY